MKENLLKKKKKGFTLIELIVVIAIIAIIALIAIPKVMGYQDSAKEKADIANAKTIATATATLFTDGKITTTATTKDITIVTSGATAGSDAEKIANALQSVPTPQAKNTGKTVPANFVVHITSDGKITVDNGTTGDQLYPTPSGVYGD